ncbi:hypothetical protein [Xanthobacter sediminis]
MSLAEYHAWLFKTATGWLGWTPAEALAAPMPMIEAAFDGRVDLLRAIFGGAEKPKGREALAAKVRAAMGFKGTRKVQRDA